MRGRRPLVIVLAMAWLAVAACRRAAPPRQDEDRPPAPARNVVHVVTYATGFSSEEVATLISLPLEASLTGCPGVARTATRTTAGLSLITLSVDGAVLPVRQAVAERIARASLPDGVEAMLGPPAAHPAVVTEYLIADSRAGLSAWELRLIQDWIVIPMLRSVPGVAGVTTCGPGAREVHIDLAPARMAAYRLTLPAVRAALESGSEAAAGGFAVARRGFGALDDIGALVIARSADVPIHVRDVARVSYGEATPTCRATRDGEEIVRGLVLLHADADATVVRAAVRARLAELRPSLPPGVELEEARAAALRVRAAVPAELAADDGVRLAIQLGKALLEVPEVAHVGTRLGITEGDLPAGLPGALEVDVELTAPDRWRRELSDIDAVLLEVDGALAKIPGVVARTERASGARGGLRLRLRGADFETLARAANAASTALRPAAGVRALAVTGADVAPELHVVFDRGRLARLGISHGDAQEVLVASRVGITTGHLIDGSRRFAIVLRLPPLGVQRAGQDAPLLMNAEGVAVPLDAVADLQMRESATAIFSEDGQRYVEVAVELSPAADRDTRARLEALVAAAVPRSAGLELVWSPAGVPASP